MVKRRNTKQKRVIADELARIDAFFSADELHAAVAKNDRSVGLATVYRVLREMKRQGKLYSYVCGRKTIFSKDDRSHCHFICEKSGKVTHIEIGSLDFLKDKVPGSIKSFQIEIRGVCRKHGEK